MTTLLRRLLLAGFATVLLSTAASAQGRSAKAQGNRPSLGPQAGFATNDLDFFIGAQFAYPVANRVDIYPSFDFYFPGNNVDVFALSGDARYWPKLNMRNPGLYVGAGLNYTHTKVSFLGVSASSDDVGLDLLGGWEFKAVKIHPFAQIKVVIGDADRVEFGGGINFRL
ncbi:MAG TPA: hypothetical protein VH879_05235 [Gemmatimonadales bacterium]